MPIYSSQEVTKIMEMLDNRFFQTMDRVDASNKISKQLTPPKVPRKTPPRFIHEGMQIEQHRTHVEDLVRKGLA